MSISEPRTDAMSAGGNTPRRQQTWQEKSRLKFFDAKRGTEFMEEAPATDFLCERVFAEGQILIIAGPPKTFKTTISLDLAVSLATKKPFLNRFEVKENCEVVYFTGEGGKAVTSDTLRRVCDSKEVSHEELRSLTICNCVPKFDNDHELSQFESFLWDEEPHVVFIDPVYLAFGGSTASNVLAQGEKLKVLSDMCKKVYCTLVLVHHFKKQRHTYAPASLDDLSQSGFAEIAGQWMLLTKRSAHQPGSGKHELSMSLGGRTGQGSCWALDIDEGSIDDEGGRIWCPTLHRPEDLKVQKATARTETKQACHESDCEAVFAWICTQTDVTKEDVRKHGSGDGVGIGHAKATRILQSLLDSGSITEVEVNRKNSNGQRKCSGYQATMPTENHESESNPSNPSSNPSRSTVRITS